MAAISRVFYNSAASTSVSLTGSGVAAGDYIVVFAYRNAATAPTVISGFTNVDSGSGNNNAYRMMYKISNGSETTTGTAANATVMHVGIYRNVTGINSRNFGTGAASTTLTIPSITPVGTTGGSWIIQGGGSVQTTSQGNFSLGNTLGKQAGTSCFSIFGDSGPISTYGSNTSANGTSAVFAYQSTELLGEKPQEAPATPTLTSPADAATLLTTTPDLQFSTTDGNKDGVTYEVQIDTSNSFPAPTVDVVTDTDPGFTDLTTTAPFSLVAHTAAHNTITGATTSSLTTTGANLIVVGLSYNTGAVVILSDSKSNIWTPLTAKAVTSNGTSRLYYSFQPTVGTGHTFTVSGASSFSSITVQAWSGAGAAPFDIENGNTGTPVSTVQPGSITPTNASSVVVSHFMFSVAGTASVSGMTLSDQTNFLSGTYYGGAIGYSIQTTATAINPTWTSGGGATGLAATIASFEVVGPPYPQGDSIKYTVQSALGGGTYYWRVRGKDPAGTNTWSSWSAVRSFTISSGTTTNAITKSLKYTIVTTPTAKTKSLKYTVNKANTAITKSAKYTVRKSILATKSLQYALSKATPITKAAKYTVKPAAIAITKTARYTIKKTYSATKSLKYAVVKGVPITKSLKYTVKKSISTTKTLKYTVVKAASAITKTSKYTVRTTPAAISRSLKYTVKKTASAITKSSKYTVRKSVGITKNLQYNIPPGAIIATKTLKYTIKMSLSTTKSAKYTIKRSLSATKSLKYTVKKGLTTTKSLKYTVPTPVKLTKSMAYRIRNFTYITKTIKYDVAAAKAIAKSTIYAVSRQQQITKALKYNVPTKIAITKSLRYALRQSHKKTLALAYRLGLAPSHTAPLPLDQRPQALQLHNEEGGISADQKPNILQVDGGKGSRIEADQKSNSIMLQ